MQALASPKDDSPTEEEVDLGCEGRQWMSLLCVFNRPKPGSWLLEESGSSQLLISRGGPPSGHVGVHALPASAVMIGAEGAPDPKSNQSESCLGFSI